MLFNSIDFAVFLTLVFGVYWFLVARSLKLQNLFLLVMSYVFYGWWDWRFLSLIFMSSLIDFLVGRAIEATPDPNRRRHLLWISLGANLGLLGFFKYFNFFVDSFAAAFRLGGIPFQVSSLNIVLPVGISFYTFQTMSYTIDIYRRRMAATRDPIAFFAFVSFFPQLVAGPIERASNLLPQFQQPRRFSYQDGVAGLRLLLWGLAKKVMIADLCARQVDQIFANYQSLPAPTLVLGALLFSFQIYGDFSGYSDMATGAARLLGFRLMRNFRTPYFALDVREFWRRWHISLSTWFRDYCYIPLGGNRGGKWRQARNSLITFTVSGLWHGANWTFVVWGLLHGLYYLPSIFSARKPRIAPAGAAAAGGPLAALKTAARMFGTFWLVTGTWVFFRSASMTQALEYLARMCAWDLRRPAFSRDALVTLALVALLLAAEWLQGDQETPLELDRLPTAARWACYYLLIAGISAFYQEAKTFIYFQF